MTERSTSNFLFFSFDGIDGTGKSTQLDLFCDWLRELGHDVVTCRDPGTTPLGEALREIVLRGTMSIAVRSEVLMYMAARAQLVDEVLHPALQCGKTVVSDRYLLASVAYQAYGLGLKAEDIWSLGRFATDDVYPTLTFLLDISVELAADRLSSDPDRLEQRDQGYHERVRAGFLSEARNRAESQSGRIAVIDANRSIDEIQKDIRQAASPFLNAVQR